MIIAKDGFLNISNDNRINLIITAAIIGGLGYYAFHNVKKVFRVSRSMQSFAEDVNVDKAINRLVRMIVLRAEDRREVLSNISTVRNVVETYRPQIIALINERKEGGTGAKQFRKKLKMLAGEIADQLNISLRKNRKGGLKLALGKSGIPPKQRGLKIGNALATNDIARTIGLRRGHNIRDLPPSQRGLRRNLIIANLPPSERGRMLGAVIRSNFSVSNALELPSNV